MTPMSHGTAPQFDRQRGDLPDAYGRVPHNPARLAVDTTGSIAFGNFKGSAVLEERARASELRKHESKGRPCKTTITG